MSRHDLDVEYREWSDLFDATCICGWVSGGHSSFEDARRTWSDHRWCEAEGFILQAVPLMASKLRNDVGVELVNQMKGNPQ
jgi:SH3-like domain-containing protein